MTQLVEHTDQDHVLDPVIDDLSITVLAGPIPSSASFQQQAQDAERIGFRRVWLPERHTVKEAGAILGAMAAVTSRLVVATGPMAIASRPPVVSASIGSSIQSMFGNRFTLGVGAGPVKWYLGHGFDNVGYQTFIDWVGIIRRLWRGEVVDYDGPAGRYEGLEMLQLPEGPPPEIVYYHIGGPMASKVAANPVFDGSSIAPTLTAEAQHRSIQRTLAECERIGRDPSTLRFYGNVTTAVDVDESTMLVEAAGRLLIYLQTPVLGERIRIENGWDKETVDKILNQQTFAQLKHELIDHSFKRNDSKLLEATRMIPDRWLHESCILGTAAEGAKRLKEYKDAGADEILIYAGPPAENASLAQAWRELSQQRKRS